ncbi:MAG: hypothetical protein ACYCZN_01930 [Candidatus Dormibacteria bacterium]
MNVELIYLEEDATWPEQAAAVWSVLKQDLTAMSEPEKAEVLVRCHEALRLDPAERPLYTPFATRGDPENPERWIHPALSLSGLRDLAGRYGAAVLVESEDEDPIAGTATVRVRAHLPSGAGTPGVASVTTQQAKEDGTFPLAFARTVAERRALSQLVRTPFSGPDVTGPPLPSTKRTLPPPSSSALAANSTEPVITEASPSPAPPLPWARGPEAEVATPMNADVEQDLSSLEAMGPATSGLEAAEPVDVDAPDWCLPTPDFGSARLPWPAPLIRKSSVGQGDVSPGQIADYKRLLEQRGVVGTDAIERFTARLVTGAYGDTLPPQALQAQELARKIEQVRELASSKEMQKLDVTLDERGYLDDESRHARLDELLGVKDERDLGFVSSRAVAQAMRALADEPTLTQIHECRGLLERIGVTEPHVMERRIADALGREDPVPPEQLSAKEIDALIHSMRPTVDRMKIKTKIPTVRQRLFPWSPDR